MKKAVAVITLLVLALPCYGIVFTGVPENGVIESVLNSEDQIEEGTNYGGVIETEFLPVSTKPVVKLLSTISKLKIGDEERNILNGILNAITEKRVKPEEAQFVYNPKNGDLSVNLKFSAKKLEDLGLDKKYLDKVLNLNFNIVDKKLREEIRDLLAVKEERIGDYIKINKLLADKVLNLITAGLRNGSVSFLGLGIGNYELLPPAEESPSQVITE